MDIFLVVAGVAVGFLLGVVWTRIYSPPYLCPGSACWKREYEKLKDHADNFGLPPVDNSGAGR